MAWTSTAWPAALNGAAIEVTEAESVDVMVPAAAEIVLEGRVRTDILEPEAPFGEASGYLGPRKMEKVFEVGDHQPPPGADLPGESSASSRRPRAP